MRAAGASQAAHPSSELHRFSFKCMGSPCELRLHGDASVRAVAEAAMSEVARLERKYSRYRDDSVCAEINRSAGHPRGVEVDDETASLLDYAQTVYEQSGGVFDITSGILRQAWDFRSGKLPADEDLQPLLARVGWQRVRWERPRLVLPLEGMEIDFGGFVKEYACDRAAELCRRRGVGAGLVDLGGDLAVVGPHPDGSAWRVGIRNPRAPDRALANVDLVGGGIASSGDYERFMVVDGRRYAHLLDPRTGWPVRGLSAVSVLASHSLVAGTASTVAMLLGADEGERWLSKLGLPHLIVDGEQKVRGRGIATRPAPSYEVDVASVDAIPSQRG